jgi:hypothetical protein
MGDCAPCPIGYNQTAQGQVRTRKTLEDNALCLFFDQDYTCYM